MSEALAVLPGVHDHVWQLVLSPDGVPGGYRAPR